MHLGFLIKRGLFDIFMKVLKEENFNYSYKVEVFLQKDGVGVFPWMANNFDKGRLLNLDNLTSEFGVSPWMTNHFDRGRIFNLDNFEKQG